MTAQAQLPRSVGGRGWIGAKLIADGCAWAVRHVRPAERVRAPRPRPLLLSAGMAVEEEN